MAGQIKQTRIFTSVSSADLPFTVGDEWVTEGGIKVWTGQDWIEGITEDRIREIVREEIKASIPKISKEVSTKMDSDLRKHKK